MTLRERLADLLTGGNYSAYEVLARRAAHMQGNYDLMSQKAVNLERQVAQINRIAGYSEKSIAQQAHCIHEQQKLIERAMNALKTIADQETPSANGTVKRMARIARLAFDQTHGNAAEKQSELPLDDVNKVLVPHVKPAEGPRA